MRFGLMMRGQFPRDENIADHFDTMLEQARRAERLGYDSIAKGLHYSTYPLQDLQLVPFLSRFAAEAPGLRLITGVVLLPLHKPLDIAEQIGTLDIMTRGKAVFGCGIGYRDVEFEAFGTTRRERGQPFEALIKDRFFVGSPDDVTAQIVKFHKRVGTNHIVVSLHWPGLEFARSIEAMALFAEEVIPRVRQGL